MPSLRPLLPALLAVALAAPTHAAGSGARAHPERLAARAAPTESERLPYAAAGGPFVNARVQGQPPFPAASALPLPPAFSAASALLAPPALPGAAAYRAVPGLPGCLTAAALPAASVLPGAFGYRGLPGLAGCTAVAAFPAASVLPGASGYRAVPGLPAFSVAAAFPAAPAPPAEPRTPGDGVETARAGRSVAPGVRLESYDRLEGDRWLRIDELVADLGAGSGVRAEYLGGVGPATVAEAAARHDAGPGRRVVAAVNGDFFDIRATGAPLGPGVRAGRLLHSASPGPGGGAAVGFGADGRGRVLRLVAAGTVTLPGGPARPLAGFNAARPPAEGYSAYTAAWSGTILPAPAPGPGALVELRDGVVAAPARTPLRSARPQRPAPGTTLLFASGERQTAALAALRPGDRVTVAARPVPASGPVPAVAVGGREPLVVDGKPLDHTGRPNDTAAPRTAAAFSQDGRRLRLVTVDGRQRDSGGLTLTGLARLLHRLGAHAALNLDGGGSSTLLAAGPGATVLATENAPSDGRPRPVPNGVVLTAPAGSGQLAGYRVDAAGGAVRLFPGLTRTLTATGHDTAFGPAAGAPRWTTTGGRIGPDAVFRADRPGPVTVEARRGAARGTLRLDVLGPLDRLRSAPARIGFLTRDESATFTLTGYDAQGAAAPVEPRDVTLHYDRSQWHVTENGHGGWTVKALTPTATGRLRATIRPRTSAPAAVHASGSGSALGLTSGSGSSRAFGSGPAFGPGRSLALGSGRAMGSDPAFGPGPSGAFGFGSGSAPASAATPGPRPGAGSGAGSVPGSGPVSRSAPAPASRSVPVSGSASGPVPVSGSASGPVPVSRAGFAFGVGPRPARRSGTGGGAAPAVTVEVPLGVGVVARPLAGLEDAAAWRGTGAAPADGRSGRGLALEPGPGRPAGAAPPRPVAVPELARSVALWVHGDASGARPALELVDAEGAGVTLRGPSVDWTGWRELNLPLPATAERPLALTRLSAEGTRPGRLVLDTLTAPTPPTGPAVPGPVRPDPVVASAADVRARPWRFAVAPATAPGTAVPAGTADLVLTGAELRPFVHRGVRFLPLDTTRRTLDGGGLARMRALTAALGAAAREPYTGALAVVAPYAPHAVDRREAALLAGRLAEFRRGTGKNAVLITPGAPRFTAGRSEGVPTVATIRTARTVFGVDAFPPPGRDWLSVRQEHP
ncbi:phosphodiester glycosidase family protein [Streptomyces sp. NPDC001568]|uniref:phosphodiester glycosidase family protein n=1 Tax=Streptomyces sp. NPDC001568 TaxID=3364588 RepID=UPI00368C3BB5